MIKITGSKLNLVNKEGSNLKAIGSVELNNIVTINNVCVRDGKNGLFVSYPTFKRTDDNYYEPVHFENGDIKKQVSEQILKEYNILLAQKDFEHNVDVRMNLLDKPDELVKGIGTVTLDQFVISGVKVMDGIHGKFVSFPQMKTKDKDGNEKYEDVAVLGKNVKKLVSEKVLEVFDKQLEKANGKAEEVSQVDKAEVPKNEGKSATVKRKRSK